MNAAIVSGPGETPVYGTFPDPIPEPGEQLITVIAAPLTNLTKGRAAGGHYSADNAYPFVPGVDGVGRLEDGSRVYFLMPRAPFGGMAQRTVARAQSYVPVPDELDDLSAAALANPGMSSWIALTERAPLQPGDTVLINGATGSAGRLAVQIARYLGAGKVIGTGRNSEVLAQTRALGADVTLALDQSGEELERQLDEQFAAGVDVVLDYLWGPSAEQILTVGAKATPVARRVRFVQVGSSSGETIPLPAALLRSSAFELLGSGLGSVTPQVMMSAIQQVLQAAPRAGFHIATRTVPLSQVAQTWNETSGRERIIYRIEGA